MELKTIDNLVAVKPKAVIGGGTGNTPSNSGGGNDGEIQKNNPFGDNLNDFKPETFRILMWFLLLIVFMTFGGLVGAYVVLATNKAAEWQPFNLPFQIYLSTALIIASTITYEISNR